MTSTDSFRFDLRVREIEVRQLREGPALLFQGRTIIHEIDGTKTYGEWNTSGRIPNYGDVYDKKLTRFQRLLNWFTN